METVREMASRLGIRSTCEALGVPRASFYRSQRPRQRPMRKPSPRALSIAERAEALRVLHEPRFADESPAEVYATRLGEGHYLCSERSLYRILAAHAEVRERRAQLRHPLYATPELLATGPNQLWSWDITKLRGPVKWCYYYLYVLLDVFSRYVVAWLLAEQESAVLARRMLADAYRRQGVIPGSLTVHADRGSSMKSKSVAFLLADLGVTRTHSRPHVPNDNPYSEAQFKTLKYRPGFPDRFGSIQDARGYCGDFFPWYNMEHHHAGIAYLTPRDVHFGLAETRLAERRVVLASAYERHPERFVRGMPKPGTLPAAVWINPRKRTDDEEIKNRIEETEGVLH